MKKFKFKLEVVQKLRERKVDEEIRKLSIVVGNINKLKNIITENNKSIQNSIDSFTSIVGEDINYLRIFDTYIKSLNLQNEYLQKNIEEQQENLEEARQKVISARKEVKVIEILKEKKYKEFYEHMLRLERAEEDEVNLRDVVEDRRLEDEVPDKQKPKRVVKKVPLQKPPANEYEKVMQYYESLKKSAGH
jgi:flagellar export protein FliJ